jgi:hypothetical protein
VLGKQVLEMVAANGLFTRSPYFTGDEMEVRGAFYSYPAPIFHLYLHRGEKQRYYPTATSSNGSRVMTR